MEIGDVLIRDTQYVWRERKALLRRDTVVLHAGKSAREMFALDGRFTCEAVVVSSAHLHSVRLQDIHTGKEFLLDTRSRGKKQVWVELFKNVRRLDAFQPLPSARQLSVSALTCPLSTANSDSNSQKLQELMRSSTLSAATGKFIRGADLAAFIGDDANVDWIGDRFVQSGVLEPCCCACVQFNGGEYIYRVRPHEIDELVRATELNATDAAHHTGHQRRSAFHRTQPCLLAAVFERVLQQFAHSDTISGLVIVQTCVRNGVFNVPTAIAVANEMLRRGLIEPHHSASTSGSSSGELRHMFSMDRESEYIAGRPLVVAESDAHTEVNEPPSEDFRRVLDEYRQLKKRYDVLLVVFGGFCVLAGIDAWGSALPNAVKLALGATLLAWFTLGDGSASLHINIRKSGQGRAVTAAFFATPVDANRLASATAVTAPDASTTTLTKPSALLEQQQQPVGAAAVGASKERSPVNESIAKTEDEMKVAAATLSAETRARDARVHSFRLAIAQAASMPYDATRVYSDDYLLSVMSVKDRTFSYAVTKIAKCLEWRVQYGVDAITLDDVKGQLTSGSMYWYGYDFENRPILWVRGRLKDWKHMAQRREVEIKAHVFLLEVGSRELMPPGSTTYTVVTDSAKLGMSHMDLRLMHGLLDTCLAHYPDRVGMVHAGPMTRFLTWVVPMLWPFLPVRLRHKVSFMHDCVKDLSKHMKMELIPKHMGGTADHVLRATPASDPNEAMDVMYMIEQQRLRMQEIVK